MGAVALGAAVGAVLRWLVADGLPAGDGFPWATFAVNVAGCLAIGCLPGLAAVRHRPRLLTALGPGLLGGFTTMSTYAEETRALLGDGRVGLAAAYVAGTLVACLLAVALGDRLTGREADEAVEP